MKKTLFDLTKEEWNTLYPVKLEDHNPEWKDIFEKEKELIIQNIGTDTILRIEHFGSTAISNIKAKPYIDLMIEIPEEKLFDEDLIAAFDNLGYTHFVVPERENIKAYSSFGKGYNLDGLKEQIFHIHMCPKNNIMWEQIDFRDYLNANQKRAKEYEALKLDLASKYVNDRGAYVLGKTHFVNETLELVKELTRKKEM